MRAQLQQNISGRNDGHAGDVARQSSLRPSLTLTRTIPVRSALLSGGVGYVDIARLEPLGSGAAALAEELDRIATADALIIDLRNSRGDRPDLLALLSSWLFDTAPAHLAERHGRDAELGITPQAAWVLPTRFIGRDVLIVVSGETPPVALRAADELQKMGRAIVVGEPPSSFGPTSERSGSFVPDLCSPSRLALIAAHLLALHRLIACGGTRTGALRATKTMLERRLTQLALTSVTDPILTRC